MATTESPSRTLYRARLFYARGEALRYVSHLDTQLVWERMLRRAGVPLAYSQGFNPRPRLHLASALPLGFLSRCEITDLWLELSPGSPAPDIHDLLKSVQASAPPGLEILRGEFVPLNLPALQTQVQSAEYLATPLDPADPGELASAVEQILSAPTLPRERRRSPVTTAVKNAGKPGKPYDLRLLIEALEVRQTEEGAPALYMRLAAREGATGRPEELLAALGQDPAAWRVERVNLLLASS